MLVMASQVYSSASETIYTQVFNNASWHFQPASLWLRAIPGISVLGEGGDPYIAGTIYRIMQNYWSSPSTKVLATMA